MLQMLLLLLLLSLLLAKSKLFWLSRHMSFWSCVSFNFAILINLLVAFFYPFGSNTFGTVLSSPLFVCSTKFSTAYVL